MTAGALVETARQLVRAVVEDPLEMVIELRERVSERVESPGKRTHGAAMPWPPCPYQEDEDWESRLHEILGETWPCAQTMEFSALWPRVIGPFVSAGVALGRGAFGGWGDGEAGLARALWCLTRHLHPAKVLETGVARGITSRVVLEALNANGEGHLWSIDRPPPGRPDLRGQIGAAVPSSLRSRWSYIKGSSRRRLREVLGTLNEIDLFIHDSRHSERNLLFELEQTRPLVRPGGFLVVDDVDLNCGMHRYRTTNPQDLVLVCPAEPLQRDPGRQNDRGVFAVIARTASD